MKKILLILLLVFTTLTITYFVAEAAGRKCTGSKSCTACKNCKGCKHCAKDGGKCSVCK